MGEARGELKQMEQGERQSEEECRGSQKVHEAEGREKEPEACAHLSSFIQDKSHSTSCLFSSVTVAKILSLSEPQLAHL